MLLSSKASLHCASGLIVPVKVLENVDLHVRVLELHVFYFVRNLALGSIGVKS